MWGPGFPQFPPPPFLSQSIEACVRFVMASYKVPTVSFFKHIRVGYTHLSMLLFPWFFCWLASSASYRALAILEYILCQIFCEVTIWGLVQLVPGAATHTAVTPSPPPDRHDRWGCGCACAVRRRHAYTSYEWLNFWRHMQTCFPSACTTREVGRPFKSACRSDMVAPSLRARHVTLVWLCRRTGFSYIFIPPWSLPDWFHFGSFWLALSIIIGFHYVYSSLR